MADSARFWETVRTWADSAGLLVEQEGEPGDPLPVPEAVCANCPICQGAATLDALDHQAVAAFIELAKSLVLGMGSALAVAAEQRLHGQAPTGPAPTGRAQTGPDHAGPVPAEADEDDADRPAPRRVSREDRPAPRRVSREDRPAPRRVSRQERPAPRRVVRKDPPPGRGPRRAGGTGGAERDPRTDDPAA